MRKLLTGAIAGLFLSVGTQPSFAQEPKECVTYEKGHKNVAKYAKQNGLDIASMHMTRVQTDAFYEAAQALGLITGNPNGIAAERIGIIVAKHTTYVLLVFYGEDGCAWGKAEIPYPVFFVLFDNAFGAGEMPVFTPVRVEVAI